MLATIVDQGITAAELDHAKSRLIADAVYAQDNQATLARWFGAALATGSTVEDVLAWPDRVRAVTADSVLAVARRYLDKRRSVTGYLIRETARPEEKHT